MMPENHVFINIILTSHSLLLWLPSFIDPRDWIEKSFT